MYKAIFNVYETIQLPSHYEDLSMIYVVEKYEESGDISVCLDDPLEKAFMLFDNIDLDDKFNEIVHHLDACAYINGMINFEPLERPTGPPPKSSIDEAPKLEIKT